MEQVYRTACHICHGSCIAKVTVEDGIVREVRPASEGVFNTGRMCPKGLFSKELIYHPDRLTTMEPPFDPCMGTYQLRGMLCRISPNPEARDEMYYKP